MDGDLSEKTSIWYVTKGEIALKKYDSQKLCT